jgi:tetratricopeptide (TPR) repeat protein
MMLVVALSVFGCARAPKETAQQLFERTVRDYHLPAGQAQGAAQQQLLAQAAAGYERLLKQYRNQPGWCVQALRSLGNVRAAQGNLDEAVTLYRRVEKEYPQYDWELIQAWKSAADLLWDAGRADEARQFYRKIINRFDTPDVPALYKTIVRGARARLG